jgi:hypothetical protein
MRRLAACAVFALLFLFTIPALTQDKLTAEDVVKKHLDSIGTPEARSAAKVRAASGKFTMDVIQGGVGTANGDAGIISAGKMLKILMRTDSPRYAGEKFWYDGKHVVVPVTDVASRTYLADFIYRNEALLRDGIFSGAIGNSWALLDIKGRGAKLIYKGLKDVDGQNLHEIDYVPKKSASELEIQMYFDPQTFRHMMTRYKFQVTGYMNVTPGIDRQARTQNSTNTTYRIEEKFSDFQTSDGVTLPRTWEIQYSVEPVRAIMMHWKADFTRVTPNPNIDLGSVFPEQ